MAVMAHNVTDPFTQILPKDLLAKIAPKLNYINVKGGEVIETKGKVFLLKSGEIEILGHHEDKQVVLETLFSGDLFGDILMGKNSLVQTQAVSKLNNTLCYVTTEDFWSLVHESPYLSKLFIKYMLQKQQQYQYKIYSAPLPARNKIMYEIELLQTKLKQSFWGKLFHLPLKISHEQLAHKTGLNRVTVTRELQKLRKEGSIIFDPKTKGIRLQKQSA